MKKTAIIAIAGLASVASAQSHLLEIDLSVVDQVTITATNGVAANSASGSDFTGFLMADFYGAAGGAALINTLVGGDLTQANNDSDGTPALFRGGSDSGLNMWSMSNDDPITFTAGSLAFTGSATWDLDPAAYADMTNGNLSGDIYAGADTDDDISAATFVGSWSVLTVPAPSGLALLGLGGIVAGRRRR